MSFEEDLKISPFNPIETNQTATRAPSFGRFTPNFTQILIRPYHTKTNIYVIIRQHFVKICKIICFQHNVQEFVILYFGQFMDHQNSFNEFLSGGSTDATCYVWCKLVISSRRSSKKYVFHCLQFYEWKNTAKTGVASTKQFSCIQGTHRQEV